MIDSTNPRIMANAIRKLFSKISAIPIVKGNPSGNGFNTLLTKLQIGTTKYKLPANVTANPEGEATDDLTKIGIGSDIFSIDSALPDYSTTEHLTGRKWVDGSDIYEKTFTNEALTRGSWTDIAHGISDLGEVVNISGSVVRPSDSACFGLNYYEASTAFAATQVGETNISCKADFTTGDYILNITIQYTKALNS